MTTKQEPMPEQGDPASKKCRWCGGQRVRHLEWLACPKCDNLAARP